MTKNDSVFFNQLYELALNHILSKAVSLAAELRLDQLIKEQPLKIETLAEQLDFHPKALWRFLRLLDAYQIVELLENHSVQASPLTSYISHICSPHIFNSYDCIKEIKYCLQHGKSCYARVFGKDFYPHILSQPDQAKMFAEWCTDSLRDWMDSVFELYDFTQFKRLVDIGGGQGHFLATILSKNPKSKGILFDQEEIVAQANTVLEEFSVRDRVEVVSGNFFNFLPPNGDIYIICRVFLNWSDEDAVKILNTCYSSMPPDSKLVIIDFYIPEKTHPHYRRGLLSDFNLFALVNSTNRTVHEWKSLVERSPFKIQNIYTSKENACPEPVVPLCVIEAVK